MEDQRPLVLVFNNDGITTKGISELVKFLRPLGEAVVTTSDAPRSGSACVLTVTGPIRHQLLRKDARLTVYKCPGTPTDCAKLVFHIVLDRRPDLAVGGINHGDNSSANVYYSDTMGVVIESYLKGVPPIGFLLYNRDQDADSEPAGTYIREIARRVLERELPPLICFNISSPDTKGLKGVRVCGQTKGQQINEWENFTHRGNMRYYWLTGEFEDAETGDKRNDHRVLENGYVAITLTTVDVTAYGSIDELGTRF